LRGARSFKKKARHLSEREGEGDLIARPGWRPPSSAGKGGDKKGDIAEVTSVLSKVFLGVEGKKGGG